MEGGREGAEDGGGGETNGYNKEEMEGESEGEEERLVNELQNYTMQSYMTLSEKQSTNPGRSCSMLSQNVYQSLSLGQYQWGVWLALANLPSI